MAVHDVDVDVAGAAGLIASMSRWRFMKSADRMDGAILTGWNTFGPFPSKLLGYVRILPHLRQGGGGASTAGI